MLEQKRGSGVALGVLCSIPRIFQHSVLRQEMFLFSHLQKKKSKCASLVACNVWNLITAQVKKDSLFILKRKEKKRHNTFKSHKNQKQCHHTLVDSKSFVAFIRISSLNGLEQSGTDIPSSTSLIMRTCKRSHRKLLLLL